MLWTLAFWKGLAERAIKTFAQSFIAALGVLGIISGTSGLTQVPWVEALSIAGLSTLLSAITSIGNADFVAGKPPAILEVVPVEGLIPSITTVNVAATPPSDTGFAGAARAVEGTTETHPGAGPAA